MSPQPIPAFFDWLFIAEGLIIALLGLPLALGKIGPNRWYGFRTRRTLEDPAAWARANRATGRGMVAAGLLTAAVAMLARLFWAGEGPVFISLVNSTVLTVTLMAAVVYGFILMRRS